jgi:O-glycosyl hydrolase
MLCGYRVLLHFAAQLIYRARTATTARKAAARLAPVLPAPAVTTVVWEAEGTRAVVPWATPDALGALPVG